MQGYKQVSKAKYWYCLVFLNFLENACNFNNKSDETLMNWDKSEGLFTVTIYILNAVSCYLNSTQ